MSNAVERTIPGSDKEQGIRLSVSCGIRRSPSSAAETALQQVV